MNVINAATGFIVQLLLAPLAHWPLVGLAVLGILSGVGAAVVFRYTSPQGGLRWVADKTRANLLAMKLFKDEFAVTLRSLGALLVLIVLRLVLTLPPMIVLAIPFSLLLGQMAMWYEFRAPRPGEPIVVEAVVKPEVWTAASDVRLELPAGLQQQVGVIANSQRHSYAWRIGAAQDVPATTLALQFAGQKFEKRIRVSHAATPLVAVTPLRPTANLLDQLLYPLEPAFEAGSPVQSISIQLSPLNHPILGWKVPWWLTFFVFSLVGALLAKPFVKVQF